MPRLESGLATRTHRVHPSEKNPFRLISGFSPLGHASRACLPGEGRAPHARGDYLCFTPAWPR
jgi:hypothetical protein